MNYKKRIITVLILIILIGAGIIIKGSLSGKDTVSASDTSTGDTASGSAASSSATETATLSPVPTKTPKPTATPSLKKLYKAAKATKKIDIKGRTKKELKTMFYVAKIDDKTWKGMQGKSYHKGCPVKKSGLRRVRILYRGYDKKTHIGELITNKKIAKDCREIFQKLYFKKYEFKSVQPIDAYGGNDRKSMKADNTSCFNHRVVSGTTNLSNHAYGLAIDINPRRNPYVWWKNGKMKVSPKNGKKYADRKKKFAHKITKKDACYKLFHAKGYFWGGDWKTIKDYQHFQKTD